MCSSCGITLHNIQIINIVIALNLNQTFGVIRLTKASFAIWIFHCQMERKEGRRKGKKREIYIVIWLFYRDKYKYLALHKNQRRQVHQIHYWNSYKCNCLFLSLSVFCSRKTYRFFLISFFLFLLRCIAAHHHRGLSTMLSLLQI